MSRDPNGISRMRAITISREYGSGGGEIARRLASYLNWKLVDHEIVIQAARELDIPRAELEAHDEYSEGIVEHILAALAFTGSAPPMKETDAQVYHEAISRVVTGAVTVGHVVVVGRGAQVLFANRHDVLHARIVAPLQLRIAYVMQREGLDLKAARSRIQLKDHDRQRYLQAQYRHNPDDARLYDLVVNTGVLRLNSVVALIAQALQYKGERLAMATEDLGPGAGLLPYLSQPGDFRPPESMQDIAN